MKIWSAVVAMTMAISALAGPASARETFVQDGAGLFGQATVSSLNQTIGDFNRQTGKEVVVVSQPSLDGATVQSAAEKVFAQQQVNGVLIFLSKAEKKQGIVTDRAATAFFPPGEVSSIRDAMRGYFRTGDFDTGITTGVNLVLSQYRSHERALGSGVTRHSYAPSTSAASFGGGMSLFWLILILIAGFLIIRAVFRAMSRPRMMPPGYGGPGPGMPGYGGPGYGGPGYGGGMGYGGGGGGGSFFSGLLGGLGGAFIGNEMFGRINGGNFGDSSNAGVIGDGNNGGQDASGWQSDAGQADMSNSSFGDYGSSGGGFDGGGGGFDSGGGGGGDSGGGW
ncbi:MAG: TPM domain-containing protein [Candidatus Eremiobacteraeota bacterium]|nr:TPM domain-containing protein [Candidatus Eremiobacteraeota bacterium]